MKIAGSDRKYLSSEYCRLIVFGARVAQWVRSLDLATQTSLSPIRRGFAPGFVNYKQGCTRLAAASDKVYQLLAHGRWFSLLLKPVAMTRNTGTKGFEKGDHGEKWNAGVRTQNKSPLSDFIFQTSWPNNLFFSKFIIKLFISPSFKNGIIRLEAGAFIFLRNRLFMTSMQLPRNRDVPSSAISKMSRSLPRHGENNMRYSAK